MKLTRLAAGALTLAITALNITAPAVAQDKKKMTVLTWNLPVYEEKIRGWIKDFNQKYPDIEVEWIDKKGTEWATFYQTQIAAGTTPDIVNIQGALWAEYASDDRLLDLGPYLAKDPSFRDRFATGALELWKVEGKSYMVPWYFNKSLLFLNKPMMEKAGLTTPPKSFDDIMAYSKKMAGEGRTGFLTTNFDWLYWPLFKMNGVDVLSADLGKAAFNTPAAVKTLAQLAEATQAGAINNISWTGRWVEPNTAFATGNVGMYLAPNVALFWAASKADWISDKTVEVMDVPGAFAVPNHHGLGVSKSTKHPEAAVELLKIATSDKWQTVMADTFSLLTLNKAVDDKLIAKLRTESPLKAKSLELVGQNLDKMTGYLLTPKEARVKDAFWSEVQPALLGQVDPKAALQKAEDKVNRALRRR